MPHLNRSTVALRSGVTPSVMAPGATPPRRGVFCWCMEEKIGSKT
jgi:hypothetical protein